MCFNNSLGYAGSVEQREEEKGGPLPPDSELFPNPPPVALPLYYRMFV